MVTSGGEMKQDRTRSHNRTPPLKEQLPDVPQNINPKVWEGVGKGGGMAGQACVAAEGLEAEVEGGARAGLAEQEAKAGPAE